MNMKEILMAIKQVHLSDKQLFVTETQLVPLYNSSNQVLTLFGTPSAVVKKMLVDFNFKKIADDAFSRTTDANNLTDLLQDMITNVRHWRQTLNLPVLNYDSTAISDIVLKGINVDQLVNAIEEFVTNYQPDNEVNWPSVKDITPEQKARWERELKLNPSAAFNYAVELMKAPVLASADHFNARREGIAESYYKIVKNFAFAGKAAIASLFLLALAAYYVHKKDDKIIAVLMELKNKSVTHDNDITAPLEPGDQLTHPLSPEKL